MYRVYGVVLASEVEFAVPLVPTDATEPDVTFVCRSQAPVDVDWSGARPVAGAALDDGAGREPFAYYRLDGTDVVRLPGVADYHLFDDRIVCHLPDPELRYLVENQLFGTVFATWLERRGTLAFHASSVAVGDGAVGFLGTRQAGKTSTAATMGQAGHPMLAEDLLPVRADGDDFVADPGYPMVRMWPEQALRFTGAVERHPLVHPSFSKRRVPIGPGGVATFCAEPRPLRRLYVLERGAPDVPVTIEPLPGQAALIELVRAAFLPVEVERFGWQRRRLGLLASLLRTVPVLRLRYPADWDRTAELVASVVADVGDGAAPVTH